MKIKGPADYPGPPAPMEPEKGSKEPVGSGKPADQAQQAGSASNDRNKIQQPGSFELALQEVARTAKSQGLQGEAAANKVIDTILEDVLGKEFMSGPQAASVRKAISPLVTQDEHLMARLNSILSRLQNK